MTRPALKLDLTLENGRIRYEPGARVAGAAAWSAPVAPRGMELRLAWSLRGKGGRDYKIAETILLPRPLAVERRPFLLTVPAGPYSFRGALLTLVWTLELVALPGEEKASLDLVVAPGGRCVDLI